MSTTQKLDALFYDKGGAVYNVQHSDFGAVGDGSTDDTSALQSAIDEAPAGSTILWPEGDYSTSSSLTQSKKLHHVFRGAVLKPTHTDTPVFDLSVGADESRFLGHLECEGAETEAGFGAGSVAGNRQRSVIFANNVDDVFVESWSATNKTNGVVIIGGSTYWTINNSDFTGVLTVDDAEANESYAIWCNAGGDHQLGDGVARNCGGGVLVGGNAQDGQIGTWRAETIFDNGVYISSGNNWQVAQVIGRAVRGTVCKIRGSRFQVGRVLGHDADNVLSFTGNGTADTTGFNGHGFYASVAWGEDVAKAVVEISQQDSESPRDVRIDYIGGENVSTDGGGERAVFIERPSEGVSIGAVKIRTWSGRYAVQAIGDASNLIEDLRIGQIDILDGQQAGGDGLGLDFVRDSVFGGGAIQGTSGTGRAIEIADSERCVFRDLDCSGESVNISDTGNKDLRFEACQVGTWIEGSDVRTRKNGQGEESANAETPTAANWDSGDIVDFTDSGDASGDGVYILGNDGSTWTQLG